MKAPITPAQAWAALVEHYLDQRKAELPEPAVTNDDLKEMESKVDYWREQHADLGLKYDNLLQAFHIAETDVKLWKGTAQARELALNEAIAICRRNAQNTSADELEALKGK